MAHIKINKRLALFYIGPLALWMIVIFTMSTGAGSSEHTRGLIVGVLQRWSPIFLATLSDYQLDVLDFVVRKLGHLIEYMLLTLLAIRALQYGRPLLRWRSVSGALALSVVYAVSDEFHQCFVPSRTTAAWDVLVDVTGSVVCAAGILFWYGIKNIERRLWSLSQANKLD